MPTQVEINNLTAEMTMDQIRATDTFRAMPTRFFVHGRDIPKSALRRDDLAKFYLVHGGKLVRQDKKELKHFRAPTHKKTSLEKKHDRHKHSLTKDHKGGLTNMRHAVEKSASLKRPARFSIAETPTRNRAFHSGSTVTMHTTGNETSEDDTDELTDGMMQWTLDPKRPRVPPPTQTSDVDADF